MKKLLLTFLSIWFSLGTHAQKIHFSDTSNVWYQFIDEFNDYAPPIVGFDAYRYVKDTVLDSATYEVFDFGIIREDTSLGKLFMWDPIGDSEIVLMDYNLQLGDTLNINQASYVVSRIDSTQINGVWHKVWHFPGISDSHGGNRPSDVIEGIGCIQHPTYMYWHFTGAEPIDLKVYCFSNNGITPPLLPSVMWFDNATSCTSFPKLDVSQLKQTPNKISVFPNPASTMITVLASEEINMVIIYNVLGQVVYSHAYNSPQVQVDISGFPTGIYFAKINGMEIRRFSKE